MISQFASDPFATPSEKLNSRQFPRNKFTFTHLTEDMKVQIPSPKFFTAFVAAALVSGAAARADLIISQTVSSPPGLGTFLTPDWSAFISIAKFNPALGHLNSVVFSMTGLVQGSAQVENTSPSSGADVKLTLAAGMALTRPGGGAPLVVATPLSITLFSASPFDGVVDFAGTSGATLSGLLGTKFNSAHYESAADLALFSGPGSISLPLTAIGASRASAGGSTISLFSTEARGEVTVAYKYTPSAVPEPRVYGAVGALLCVGFAALRRLRSKSS